MTTGEKIRLARKNAKDGKGMTQKELAGELGVSYVLVNQYENGKRNPKVGSLYRIAQVLGVPLSSLIGDSPEYKDLLASLKEAAGSFVETVKSKGETSNVDIEISVDEAIKNALDNIGPDMTSIYEVIAILEALGGTTEDDRLQILQYIKFLKSQRIT